MKMLIAKWLDEQLAPPQDGKRRYHVWFTKRANEYRNEPSSNPLPIFHEVDTAVGRGQADHSKIKRSLLRMHAVVEQHCHDGVMKHDLHGVLTKARVEAFRPQLWRIDLMRWDATNYDPRGSFEFESKGYTLPADLFEVIIP